MLAMGSCPLQLIRICHFYPPGPCRLPQLPLHCLPPPAAACTPPPLPSAAAVLTLKVVVCPLLALAVAKSFAVGMGEDAGKRVPQAPLAAVMEMAIKYFLPH